MWKTIGHETVVRYFQRALARGEIGHAYLFVGLEGVGKATLATDMAAALLCPLQLADPCGECSACLAVARWQHPDLHIIHIEEGRKSIRTQQIAELQHTVALRPLRSPLRVSLIFDAQVLQPEAAQRLLKTLEEPPEHNVLILTATDAHALPATLVSRCQVWRLSPLPQALIERTLVQHGIPQPQAASLAAASRGRLGWALRAAQAEGVLSQYERALDELVMILEMDALQRINRIDRLLEQNTDVPTLLELWGEWWRALLLVRAGLPSGLATSRTTALMDFAAVLPYASIAQALRATWEAQDWVRANVSSRLALETLVLQLPVLPATQAAVGARSS